MSVPAIRRNLTNLTGNKYVTLRLGDLSPGRHLRRPARCTPTLFASSFLLIDGHNRKRHPRATLHALVAGDPNARSRPAPLLPGARGAVEDAQARVEAAKAAADSASDAHIERLPTGATVRDRSVPAAPSAVEDAEDAEDDIAAANAALWRKSKARSPNMKRRGGALSVASRTQLGRSWRPRSTESLGRPRRWGMS